MSTYRFRTGPRDVPLVRTPNREIKTAIPAPGTEQIISQLSKFESRSMHGQLPLVWDRAEDFSVYDHCGNKWLDFTSTIFVANVGHSNPKIINAIRDSTNHPMLACYAYPNKLRSEYLSRLVGFAGTNFEKAFLLSAGTEATEAALKLMKMHGNVLGKRRNIVVGIKGNWHGRTLGAQVLSNNQEQRSWISNPNTETYHIDFPYQDEVNGRPKEFLHESLQKLEEEGISLAQDVSGFMLETFQGWGAFYYPREYVQELRAICDEHGILLTFDEMQAGFGRTGMNFGYEHYGVKADLICCGKGMGGGLPISGVIGSARVMDLPEIGNMSSTHSGNPLMCGVGLAVLDELDSKGLVEAAKNKGEVLHARLQDLRAKFPEHIKEINGRGLIAAIVFDKKFEGISGHVSQIVERCFHKGLLLVHTGRESIKIGPPLTISESAILEGVDVIEETLLEVLA